MATKLKSGTIKYTGRAFHQDAMDAMKGDIVRGIIELITNSDDSYVSQEENGRQKKIIIEVEHRRSQSWMVVVRDRATGMSSETMENAITQLGGRTSGFELGQEKRGNLGRGAKDIAAFGDVTFKSIKNGHYAELLLKSNGDWFLLEDRKTLAKDRTDLGINRGNGTVVELEASVSLKCPRHDTLKHRLSSHFQLRDILSDPNRKVELVNLNDNTRDLLLYQYPELLNVFEGDLSIDGYPDTNAKLIIKRFDSRCDDDDPYDPGRATGILIKGARAIYDNTLFKFENNVQAAWFTGELVCKDIDQLAREYDDLIEKGETPPTSNPRPIISRQRDGLHRDHPFVDALYTAVESELGTLIAIEEEKAKSTLGDLESEQTKADLDRLAKEASKLISEELKNIEAEELPEGTEEGEVAALTIIPEVAFAYVGESRTLTVAARKEGLSIGDCVTISTDPEGVVQLNETVLELRNHSRREDLLVAQIRLTPLIEGESTLISASIDGRSADAMVEVKPPLEIVEVEIEPPETFMFERSSYRIGWKKGKDIWLHAPADVVAETGYDAMVSSTDPGVLIKTPNVQMAYDDSVDFYKAKIRVDARSLNSSAELHAKLGDFRDTAHVKVTRKEEFPGIDIQLVRESFGIWRALIETDTDEAGNEITAIKIAGQHPGIRHVLGENFEGQGSVKCRLIMAEIVADIAARHVVRKLYQTRRTTEEFDVERYYREHYKRMDRFLPRFQKVLVGYSELSPSQG